MEISINDAGTWRVPNQVWINDAGTWRPIQQVWLNDSGTWRQVYTAFTSSLVTFSTGSGSVTVPIGANNVTIEVWGGGGGGGGGTGNLCTGVPGFSGGGSGYSRSLYSCAAGQTILYSVGVGGANGGAHDANGHAGTSSTAYSGTLSISSLIANGGQGGSGDGGAGAGAGGTATGGNQANVTGATGSYPQVGIYTNTVASGSMYGAPGLGTYNSGMVGKGGLVSFYFHS
jgi:hypothetical protein